MKILYFTQFYKPENIAAAFRATENAKYWSEAGHNITVFTGYPNYPTGKIFDGYKPRLYSEELDGNVRVIRSKLIAKKNVGLWGRLVNMFSYFFFGLINVLFNKKIGKKYDVVLGTSGVIFNALLAWIYSAMHKIKFVFELRDITYMQMIATGKKKNSIPVKMIKGIELFLCKKAKHIVVVSNGFKKTLAAQGIDENKISVITNGVSIENENKHFDVSDKFVVSYIGTIGISQNLKVTIDYVGEMRKAYPGIEYIIIGEGADKENVKAEIKNRKLEYVTILDGMSMDRLTPYYENSMISIVTLKKDKAFKDTIPSKIFQSMGRHIAVLFIGPKGEASHIIDKYNAGITLTGTYEEDISKIRAILENGDFKDKICKMGDSGYEAAKLNYSREVLANKYLEVLKV